METEQSKDHLCVYCDLHLESMLVPCGSLTAGLYGGDTADCNPFEYWRCSRPDCSRCYDTRMYGYFNMDRTRGSSVQLNAQAQDKCYKHQRPREYDPFMCISKFGQGRRFRCPFHDCDSVGSIVAEYVADLNETEEVPHTQPVLTGNDKREAFELSTFYEFAIAAGLAVESADNAKPRYPDIRCLIGGEEYWFELGQIIDATLARAIHTDWPKDPTSFSFEQKEPFLRMIEKKAAAQYETNGRPVDFVLHFEQPPDRTALKRHFQEHAIALNDLMLRGPFSRIWIYDGFSKSVLWKSFQKP